MASVSDSIVRTYRFLFDEMSHPITKDWLLIPSPFPLLGILITYNIFCTKIGPMLMKNRPPYKLNIIIKLYNVLQVIISLYIFYRGFLYIFSGKYNFQCEGPDEISSEREHLQISQLFQVYFMTKLLELLDTIFFVLRKSNRQVTFLHLYHHTLMPTISWIAIKYFPGGQPIIIGTINSLVHVFMYTYYLLSGLGPKYQKYLWWKKHLTTMQIVQFLLILIHSLNSLFHSCSYPMALKMVTVVESVTFVYMFCKFYYYSYFVPEKLNRNKNRTNERIATHISYDCNGHSMSDTVTINNDENYMNGNSNVNSVWNEDFYDNTNYKSNRCNHTNGKCESNTKMKHL